MGIRRSIIHPTSTNYQQGNIIYQRFIVNVEVYYYPDYP